MRSEILGSLTMQRLPPAGWTPLEPAGLVAIALRVPRRDISYFKYLFESYEGVAIVRTVETIDARAAVIAILAPPDQADDADGILCEVERLGSPPVSRTPLPAVCAEDWFLEAWVNEADDA
jgi:Domain of unknown function (DUF4911)